MKQHDIPGLLEQTALEVGLKTAANMVPKNSEMWSYAAVVFRVKRQVLDCADSGEQVSQLLRQLSSIGAFATCTNG